MKVFIITVLGFMLSLAGALAVPIQERAVEVYTVYETYTAVVEETSTVYAPDATGAEQSPSPTYSPERGRGKHRNPSTSPKSDTPDQAPTPTPFETPTTTPVYVPATTPTTSVAPTPPVQKTDVTSPSSGTVFDGEGTFYEVGTGSCGWPSKPSDHVVALSYMYMGRDGNPNKNPHCGEKLECQYNNGPKVQVTVVDTCEGCKNGDVDFSYGAYDALGCERSAGRVPIHCTKL